VHNVSGVRQIEVHTAEPLATVPSHLEVEIAIEKLPEYNIKMIIVINYFYLLCFLSV
jgi:CBS domain-containing protein